MPGLAMWAVAHASRSSGKIDQRFDPGRLYARGPWPFASACLSVLSPILPRFAASRSVSATAGFLALDMGSSPITEIALASRPAKRAREASGDL